jgi:hypothetical protein
MPPEAAENIHNEISNENISTIDQMILIRSLPYIGTQKSVDVLFSILKNNYNIIFLIEITKALDELLSEKNYILNTELLTETREYIYENILLSRKARTEIGKTNEFYAGIYLDHALMNLSVLLNLFSLEYGRKTLRNIQIQLFGNDELLKSNALELLEITLEKKTAEKYMPLFSILIEKELPTGKGLSHETVTEIAQSRNQWLKNVTKCIVEKENKEMPQGVDIDYYEMISRISFLKKVDLFANVPADYLASIVGLLKEKTFYKGEVLFSQGDPGDAFYLIKTGVISVMTNNIEVAELGPGQGIGEMALIEGETRSATAILKEDSELFRLSSSDFNKLLNSYPSITISLLKTISRRLRSRMAKTV